VILAASACRTTITEVYQSSVAGGSAPGIDGWGCENASAASNYVESVHTDANGVVTVMAQNIDTANINGKVVTLVPYKDATTAASASDLGTGITVYKWVCGGAGTTVPSVFLPGSCRG